MIVIIVIFLLLEIWLQWINYYDDFNDFNSNRYGSIQNKNMYKNIKTLNKKFQS